MRLEYTLTLDDYKAAQILHCKQKFGRRVNFFIFFRAIPILAVIFLLASIVVLAHGNKRFFVTLLPFEFGLLWLAVFLPLLRFVSLRIGFKQLFPPHRTDRGSHLEIKDDCILSGIPGVSEGRIFWPGVFAFAQDDRITMIYTSERRFLFFPTSALTPAQQSELNDLIARHVAKAKP
jgi:hypothetical protein